MRYLKILPLLLITAVLLSGCSSKHLPEGVTEKMVKERTEEVLEVVNERDYADLYSMFRADLRDSELTVELISETLDVKFEKIGGFVEIGEMLVAGETNLETYEETAFCICVCDYERGTASYRIVFDADLQLIGLFTI